MNPLIVSTLVVAASTGIPFALDDVFHALVTDPDCPKPFPKVSNGCCEPFAFLVDPIPEILSDCLDIHEPLPMGRGA